MSAQAYTNKQKVLASARNTKVQLLGNVGDALQPLSSTVRLSPNFAINNYKKSNCDLPSFREKYCGGKAVIVTTIVLTADQQAALGMNVSSFFFVVNRNSDPGTRYNYSSITRLYTRISSGTTFDSNNSTTQALWGNITVSSFIGLPVYSRDICIGILNTLFSNYLSTNLINGVRYTLQASVDSDYRLVLTLTPPVPVQTPDVLRYIGIFFGNGPTNGSANLGVTPSGIGTNSGVTGSAFMLEYDAAQAGNTSQTIRTPYVFLDFIPRE